ncbi:uncharacterized protein LTHEOB_6026 [Lasiodiplodia theobromae]|uniref:uncharacterized protein n=1 Tax=Lasiodiplodia theobromae TaxID=45133 RepID=UPI0015C33336|nr:uncharacterized protein LTHEOB_6026 [Lasiodiplodia theobromae]KAF4544456.1 hypothetical protein LTHEOB_6026 [Lasiodiplodia theobromae]
MQILASPSRYDIDSSHRQRQIFSIGTQSLKNLKSVNKFRAILWIILAVSSIPLHITYNSVIFPTTGAYAYKVAVVTPDFLNGARFDLGSINNLTSSSSITSNSSSFTVNHLTSHVFGSRVPSVEPRAAELLELLQSKYLKQQLKNMTIDECIEAYLVNRQITHRNLIAVSDDARSSTSSVVWLEPSKPLNAATNWICRYRKDVVSGWMLNGTDPDCAPESALFYEPTLFIVVIVANAIKAAAMIATLLQYKRPALVTIGDALASFLEEADETTRGLCLATANEFASGSWDARPRIFSRELKTIKRSTGASRQQWITTMAAFATIMVVGTILFASIYDKSNRLRWSLSGSVSKESVKLGVGLGAASVVILANLPQVVLWLNLVFLNRLVTCMAVSREWSLMAHARKGLRTSASRGEQRSTYWLQLPLKFAIPMLAVSTGLHYLASQALFFGSLRIYSPYDDGQLIEDYTGLGYAQNPAHVLLITLLLLNSAIILWGKSYNKPGIPHGGFNSAYSGAW